MYEAVSVLLKICSVLFQGYCLQYFYGNFLESRIQNRWISGLVAAVLYGGLRLSAGIIMPQDNGSFWIFINLAVSVGMIAVTVYAFYKAEGKLWVFLIAVFMAVSEISVFLAYTIGQIGNVLIALWGWCLEKKYIVSASVLSAIVHVTVIGTNVLAFVVFAVVTYGLLKAVVKAFQEKSYRIGNTELLFLTTPSLIGVLLCSLLRAILLTMEDGEPKQIYERYPPLVIIVPAILILLLFSIIFEVKLFQDMIYRNREKNGRVILEKQVNSLQEHIREMERVYSGIRGMKHDIKNTIFVIMQLSAGKEEELQVYLEELNRTMDKLEFRFKTGNTVVDTLLNMKYHEITSKDYQQTWMINKDGSIQSTVYSVTETEMTNAERMKKNMDKRLEKQKEKKAEEEKGKEQKAKKEEQAEKLDGDTEKISILETAGQKITVKHVEAESEIKARERMQKEKQKDAYYPKFDLNI